MTVDESTNDEEAGPGADRSEPEPIVIRHSSLSYRTVNGISREVVAGFLPTEDLASTLST